MKKFKTMAIVASALLLAATSCKKEDNKDDNPTTETKGEAVIKVDNVWGPAEDQFALSTLLVHPMTGDSLTFTTLKYYISNIKLQDTDGNWWVQDESYYLYDASKPETANISLSDVPKGEYVKMEITFGVDSARNVSGAQTGALDPANNMFWTWNSGYIMVKAEGNSPQSPDGDFIYHLGGFTGDPKAVNTLELTLPQPMSISSAATPAMHMMLNVAKLWHTVGSVSNVNRIHMPNTNAAIMATDFQRSAYIDHIHN